MNDQQLLRYSRHILLDEIGIEGQQRLLAATALVVGAGGLGSPAALYLASAGVGTIILADSDTVDLSNLQRQILHRQESIGSAKAVSGKTTLASINPEVEVEAIVARLGIGADARNGLLIGPAVDGGLRGQHQDASVAAGLCRCL